MIALLEFPTWKYVRVPKYLTMAVVNYAVATTLVLMSKNSHIPIIKTLCISISRLVYKELLKGNLNLNIAHSNASSPYHIILIKLVYTEPSANSK